jgi:hypothetical protein
MALSKRAALGVVSPSWNFSSSVRGVFGTITGVQFERCMAIIPAPTNPPE